MPEVAQLVSGCDGILIRYVCPSLQSRCFSWGEGMGKPLSLVASLNKQGVGLHIVGDP